MNYWKISFGCLAGLLLAVVSCSHPGGGGGPGSTGSGGNTGSGGSGSCTPGTLGCACNGTSCDVGLSCAAVNNEQQCVTTAAGSGGANGSGSGGAVASSGGATGSAGTTGSGGSATGGAAGTGSPGSGGAVSSGGDSGTGGAAGASATGSGGSAPGGSTGSGGSGSGGNLIANGDFSQADTNWHFENGTASVNNGQYCASSISSGALFGWQNTTTPLMLSGTTTYTLSYQASGSNSATIHVKVADAASPYTPDDYDPMNNNQLVNDTLGSSLQTFTHMFMPAMGDDSNAGLAFFIESGQNVCIANVSLVAN